MRRVFFLLLISSLFAKAEENDCDKIKACKDKEAMVAYSCLYHEMQDKVEYDNTSCKKLITQIGKESFVPLILSCVVEAQSRCYLKKDVDLYRCLRKIRTDISGPCRKKVERTDEKFAELVTIHFPEKTKDTVAPETKSGR